MNITKSTKITLLFLSMTTMMSNVAVVTTIPHLKNIFNTEPNIELLSRLMLTLPSLSIALLAPFLGHLVYKIGKKNSALTALILFSVFGSAGLYLNSIDSILISRALLGTAVATLMIVSTSLIGDYFKNEHRHRFMGLQGAFIAIGGVFFVVGGGVLSDINWRYPFAIYFIGLILLPFVLLFLKEKNINEETNLDQQLQTKVYFIYILAFIFMAIFFILPTQIPFLMMNVFNASGTLTGAIISVAFIANALGGITFAKVKNIYTFRTIYMLGLLIVSFGFILISLIDRIYLFFFSAMLLGFGAGIMMTNVNAWMLHLVSAKKRVKSSGYLTSSFFLGQFFSPIITMPIVHYFGVQHSFLIIGLLIISTLVLFSLYFRSQYAKQ